MLSFAAENEARVRAMLAARANVKETLDELTQRYRRVRQDEITADIVELAKRVGAGVSMTWKGSKGDRTV